MRYFILFIIIILSCNVSHLIRYGNKYHMGNELIYFNKGDSCHIIGFEEDMWAKYFFSNDTLNIINIYDYELIPYINCIF